MEKDCGFRISIRFQGIQISPYRTGYIKGDLSRLYIQTDSGMYVSFDLGVYLEKRWRPILHYEFFKR